MKQKNTTPDRKRKAEKTGKRNKKKDDEAPGLTEMRKLMEGWAAKKAVKRSRENVEEERDDATKELNAGDETGNLVKRLRKKFD